MADDTPKNSSPERNAGPGFNQDNFLKAVDFLRESNPNLTNDDIKGAIGDMTPERIDEFSKEVLSRIKVPDAPSARLQQFDKFVPDSAESPVKAFASSFAETLTFGASDKIEAVARATVSDDELKDFGERYKLELIEDEKRDKMLADRNPVSHATGIMLGYALNPLARFVRGAFAGATAVRTIATGAALEVGAVEGTRAALDTVNRSVTENGSLADIASDEFTKALIDTSFAAVGGAAVGAVLKPLRVAALPVKAQAGLAKNWLGDDAVKLLDNIDVVSKLDLKDKKQAQQVVGQLGDDAVKMVVKIRDTLQEQIEKAAPDARVVVEQMSKDLGDSFNLAAIEVAEAVNKKAPKGIARAVANVADSMQFYAKNIQTAFGQRLGELTVKTGNKAIDARPLQEKMLKMLVDEGVAILDDSGELVFKQTDDAASEFLRDAMVELLGKSSLTLKELHGVATMLGPVSGKGGAASAAWSTLRNLMKDGATWGDDVAKQTDALMQQYGVGLQALKSAKRNLNALKQTSARIADDVSAMDEIADTLKAFTKLDKNVKTLNGLSELGNTLDPVQVKAFNQTFKQVRETFDIAKARRHKNVVKTMKEYLSGKLDIGNEQKQVLDALENWDKANEVRDVIQQTNMVEAVRKAVLNPFDKNAVKAAREWALKSNSKLTPELSNLLNRAAKWHRIAALDKVPMPNQAIKMLKTMVDPAEAQALQLVYQFDDRIREILTDVEVAKAFAKQNPGILRTVTGGAGGSLLTGGALVMDAAGLGGASLTTLMIFRLMRSPQAFIKLLKAAGKPMAPAEVFAIEKSVKAATRLFADESGRQNIKEAFGNE